MFRIAFCVEDKNLADTLRSVAGKAIGMEPPQPVANAVIRSGRIAPATGGTMLEMFAAHLRKTKATVIIAKDCQQWMEPLGRAPSAYSAVLKSAVDEGLLRKQGGGSKTVYYVTVPAPASKMQVGSAEVA